MRTLLDHCIIAAWIAGQDQAGVDLTAREIADALPEGFDPASVRACLQRNCGTHPRWHHVHDAFTWNHQRGHKSRWRLREEHIRGISAGAVVPTEIDLTSTTHAQAEDQGADELTMDPMLTGEEFRAAT